MGAVTDAIDLPADTVPDVTARGLRIQVLAVKNPGQWIIRGIGCFGKRVETLREWIEPYVALVPDPTVLEWSQHAYFIPSYLASSAYGLDGMGYPASGVYLFSHVDHQWQPDVHDHHCAYRNARMLRNETRHL